MGNPARIGPGGAVDDAPGHRYDPPFSPAGKTSPRTVRRASVAQLVEHRFCKPVVVGSSPVASSRRRRVPPPRPAPPRPAPGNRRAAQRLPSARRTPHETHDRRASGSSDSEQRRNQEPGHAGWMPEWLKGTGCKPVGFAYAGSNPAPPTNASTGQRASGGPDRSLQTRTTPAGRGDQRTRKRRRRNARRPRPADRATRGCGCSSMVEPQPSKLVAWVRFPSPAPGCGRQLALSRRLLWLRGRARPW